MAARRILEAAWTYHDFVLTNAVVAEQGKLACLDTTTGKVTKGAVSTTLIPIGWFAEGLTGDGTKKISVRLFQEIQAAWWDNGGPTAAVAADVGNECYVHDDTTVTMTSTGRSKAGRLLAVDSAKGALVAAGLAVTGPTGGTGAGAAMLASVADRAAVKAIVAADRVNGQLILVRTDNSLWRFDSASTAASDGADGNLVLVPDAGTGRWIRADKAFVMKLAIGFGTADNAVLSTVPAGFAIRITGMPFWDVVTGFTGGAASAIGIDSSLAGHTTKGDLLGGATGDVAATLVAGVQPGTIGPKLDTLVEIQAFLLKGADEIHFGRITSAFTAGAGFVCFPISVELVG